LAIWTLFFSYFPRCQTCAVAFMCSLFVIYFLSRFLSQGHCSKNTLSVYFFFFSAYLEPILTQDKKHQKKKKN
jgi:hypothetical protein